MGRRAPCASRSHSAERRRNSRHSRNRAATRIVTSADPAEQSASLKVVEPRLFGEPCRAVLCQLNRVAQWHRLAQFHPSTRKTPCKSSARAIRCAKLGHRLTQCTGYRPFVFPQIFCSFPQNSITERQPSQSGDCLPLRQSRAFANAGRFRRQQRIACCGAGSYRHVLILFVHIDRGRGRMCFCKSLAHCRKTQLPKAAWTTAARGAHPASKSPPPRATSWVPSCAVPHCATQSSLQRTEFGCRFSSSDVMSSRVLPSVQWRTCSRALSARMTTTQRPILCHLCHLVPLCHPV